MTRQQIKDRFHSSDQMGIMHSMFDEVVDFTLDNYTNKEIKTVYVVVGQTEITNFVMKIFSTRKKAKTFIIQKNKKRKWDYAPYIEVHKLS